ncbi:MAG: dipeptide ABC transporter ATP-binding protein [Planctomycetes bacterium]|nr:dipeptide ABC transporter ATP-binding protein [Planctomycetota bacterium]
MALLEVRDLRTYFRTTGQPRKVVDGISFAIEGGETLGLVGESGCGKSLTALSMMQLIPRPGYVAGGQILLGGRDVARMSGPEKRGVRGRHMAMIFQEPMTSLNPVLSVKTQLLEAIRHGRPEGVRRSPAFSRGRDAEIKEAVEALRLTDMPEPLERLSQYPHQLSGGMRQRVMIAMALACRPELLIADEPTTALDVTVEARILDLLRDLQHRLGTAILFITHDLAVVSEMAHRVAIMYAGKIVETATTASLFARPSHPYTERLLRCLPTQAQRGRYLETIRGVVPDPKDYAPGCRFSGRCPHAFGPCRDLEPPLCEIEPGHAVACHLYAGPLAPPVTVSPPVQKRCQEPYDFKVPDTFSEPAEGLLLEARRVAKHFPIHKGLFQRVVGHVKAVDGVDLAIRRGTTLALVGESGCGKTTLGKTLIRLLPATAGTVRFAGSEVTLLDDEALRRFRREAQIVFQDPYSSLNPRMTVEAIVEEGMLVHGIGQGRSDRRDRVRRVLEGVGLQADALGCYPHEFSGGQRQRIGVARALAVEPKFLVLDEPTSALDVSIQAQILNLLRRLQGEGRERLTYLFITHDLGIVEYMADEVAVMYLGRIVERSPTKALFGGPCHPYTRALLSAIPGQEAPGRGGRIRLEGDVPSPSRPPPGCHFHLRCPEAMPVCREVYPGETDLGGGRMVRCHLYGDKENAE